MCFPTRERHISCGMLSRVREIHFTGDMCSGKHISRGNRYYGHYLRCVQISNIRQKAAHSLILKKEKNFIFLTFFWFSNDKKKEEAEEKPPIVSFGQLVSYRTLLQAEVFNFDHWLNDSPTENSIVNSRNCPDWRACS